MKFLIILLVTLPMSFSVAQGKSVASEIKAQKKWAQYKKEILSLQAKYSDRKLSLDKKMDLLPQANGVLSEIQDLKLNQNEKMDLIRTVVGFLAAAEEVDVTNSHCDTVYQHYEANKKAYDIEIKKQPKAVQEKILENFQGLKESTAPESESEED